MFWRKSKSEAAASVAATQTGAHSRNGSRHEGLGGDPRQATKIQAERRSLISIFILCRVLMEVVRQTPTDVLGPDLSEKLEEIVFKQLKTAEPDWINASIIRRANWNLFAELLGEMSDSRFISVGDRFIADLEKVPALVSKDAEINTQLVIYGMRYLKLKLYPMDMLEESANFLESLAKFFSRSQTQRVILAYSEVISQILSPIAGVATAELNHPTWVQAVETLYNRSTEMINRSKHWQSAFTLATTTLSVAPQELFSNRWMQLFETNVSRLKEKSNRAVFYTGVSRLLWVFMCRCTESLNNTTKKLEIINKSILTFSSKKAWVTHDPNANAPIIALISIASYGYRQFVLENVLNQMLLGSNASDLSTLDTLIPERSMIAIRAFVEILSFDLTGDRPRFPTDAVLNEMSGTVIQPPTTQPSPSGTLLEFYDKFSLLLVKILTMCDTQFYAIGSSVGEEKQAPQKASGMGVSFHFSNNDSASTNLKKLELFCVVIDSMPWCLTRNNYNKVIDILCRNAINSNPRISQASTRALKNIAQTRNTRMILAAVSKQLFAYDEKLFATYDPGSSARSDYEKLLRIYVELLEVWIEKIRAVPNGNENSSTSASSEEKMRNDDAIVHGWWPTIEEVEGNGLYFLCSAERTIRHLAIKILRLTSKFDTAVREHEEHQEKTHSRKPSKSSMVAPLRLISFLEKVDLMELVDRAKPEVRLSMPEQTRLTKLMSSKKKEALIKIADSDHGIDSALWLKAFPTFMKECFENYPIPVAIARNVICFRLVGMHDVVTEFMRVGDPVKPSHGFLAKHSTRTHPEAVIEQWRIYLIVACIALTLTDEQKLHIPDSQSQHGRKKSVQKITIHHQRITSIKSVFRMVIPLLGVDHPVIQDAVVTGISCINVNTYQALLECMKPAINSWKNDTRQYRNNASSAGGASNSSGTGHMHGHPRRDPSTGYRQDRVITEIVHVFRVTAYYLEDPIVCNNEYVVNELIDFLRDLRTFLATSEVQTNWEYQKLRRYFCGIVEKLVLGVGKSDESASKVLTFDTRLKFYSLIEEWCEYGANHTLAQDREAIVKRAALATASASGQKEWHDKNMVIAGLEFEKRKSELAILSAMAALCAGPVIQEVAQPNGELRTTSFNVPGIMMWVNTIMREREELQQIGQKALKNLLTANPNNPQLFNDAIAHCYQIDSNGHVDVDAKVSRRYFKTVAEVVLGNPNYPYEARQVLTLGLFKTGDEDFEIRSLAVQLLKATELRFYGQTCMHEFEARALSRSPPIYKRVLFDLSARFAQEYPQESAMILSEMFMFFHKVSDTYRRDILSVLLPWVQSVELKVEQPNDQLSSSSMMVLSNMLEITVSFSDRISNEVEALWVAIINGISGNLKVVMDFLFRQSMARPDATFVHYARKIVLYMSTFQKQAIIDMMIAHLTPKAMIPMHPEPYNATEAKQMYPHVAEISELLPPRTAKENAFSCGQLSMIMLVDLLISPDETVRQHIPLLLHVALVLLDHYLPIVHEQAREMLVLLLNGFASRTDESVEFCNLLRKKDAQTHWGYDDLNSEKDGAQTPRAMDFLICSVLEHYSYSSKEVQNMWGRIALNWATACPVRHIACRSFQVFRCLLSFLDQGMLADMLARLSNTISDSNPDIQGFAMQILMTLNAVTAELASEELINYPQLFWAAVACMNTIHEQEFIEVLSVLEKFLSKIDLDAPDTVSCLVSTFPQKWEGKFEGLQNVIMIGLRSVNSWDQSLQVLDKLNQLSPNEIIGSSERLVMAICANMPRYLHALEAGVISPEIEASCYRLRDICDQEERTGLSRILTSLGKGRFRTKKDFLNQTTQAIRANFFPEHEVPVLSFFLGILSNKMRWVKEEAMEMLKQVFPLVDMQREELAGVGADLISPLLRLLQTDLAEQALSVLDEAASISSSKMDKHVLRMSLGNRTLRKEYEKTHTLFGIPDESGWAVPMPAVTASITRNNVHAVFYTCATAADYTDQDVEDEFQFHKEEQYGYTLDRTETAASVEGSMNQMWTALDSLDSFFANNNSRGKRSPKYHGLGTGPGADGAIPGSGFGGTSGGPSIASSATVGHGIGGPSAPTGGSHSHAHSLSYATDTDASTENIIDPVESAPQLYDKKVSVILNRSLARTPSTTSFKTSLADSFVGPGASSSSGSDMRMAHLKSSKSFNSRRREIVDFSQDLAEISGSSDGDDEHGDDQGDDYEGYNSFDTVQYGQNNGSSSSQSLPRSSNSGSPAVSPPILKNSASASMLQQRSNSSHLQNSIHHAPAPATESSAIHHPESSFRLESLLKGASSIGKKKKGKDKDKDSKKTVKKKKHQNKDGGVSEFVGSPNLTSPGRAFATLSGASSSGGPMPGAGSSTSVATPSRSATTSPSNAGYQFPPPK